MLLHRLERLPAAIHRALRDGEERAQCRTMDEAKGFLEHLLAASPTMVFRFHPETHVLTYVSPNIGWLLGYGPDEAVGQRRLLEPRAPPRRLRAAVHAADRGDR